MGVCDILWPSDMYNYIQHYYIFENYTPGSVIEGTKQKYL